MVDIDITIICNICGKEVTAEYQNHEIIVTPCEKCLEDKRSEGYDHGAEDHTAEMDLR